MFSGISKFLLISFAVVTLTLMVCIIYIRHRHKRELAAISDILQSILEKGESDRIPKPSDTKDTMVSKIRHQVNHLEIMTKENNERIRSEKEDIQNLITEIAHQLRTPLLNIKAYLELLSCEDNERIKRRYLTNIQDSNERLTFLVESFIKMSRLAHDFIQPRLTTADLKPTLLKAIYQVQAKAEAKHITIEVEEEKAVKVPHDANWLAEAIYNLLDNSVKYSREHGKIVISIVQNDMYTKISVRDYGIGIAGEDINCLFRRFYRGANALSVEGYGIGLYLSREIVLRHHGFMKLQKETPGMCASIYLE